MKVRNVALIVVSALAFALLPVIPASAEGVPPGPLGECLNDAQDRGGWAIRDFDSYGTDNESDTPVRPRHLTLGEPCMSDTDDWSIPLIQSELKFSEEDRDDIWNDPTDAGYASGGEICKTYGGGTRCLFIQGGGTFIGKPYYCAFVSPNQTGADGQWFATWTGGAKSAISFGNATGLCNVTFPGYELLGVFLFSSQGGSTARTGIECIMTAVTLNCGDTGTSAVNLNPANPGTILGYQSSLSRIGKYGPLDGTGKAEFTCSSTRSGSTSVIASTVTYTSGEWTAEGPYQFGLPIVDGSGVTQWERTDLMKFGPTATTCKYLSAITLTVCVYVSNGPDGYSCNTTEWLFDKWQLGPLYEPLVPQEQICEHVTNGGMDADCERYLYPERKDYSTYADACPNPPEPAWLDFGWLPEFVAYHAKCLFVPQGGADADGSVRAKVAASSIGQLASIFTTFNTALTYSGGCGVVASYSGPSGFSFSMNTCDLESFSGVKPYLSAVLWIAFGFWSIWFVAAILLGIINRRSPNPMGGDE